MGKIWLADQGFDIDATVIRWDEGPKWDSRSRSCINPSHPCSGGFPFSDKGITRTNRYMERPLIKKLSGKQQFDGAQALIRQFIIHHDGCRDAAMCFNVLHNERGLSCHFLLDNDGTIYQTLDMAYMGFHAAGFNANSVGIEISNRGDAKRDPNYYRGKRDIIPCTIHGHDYKAFEFTKEQMTALVALAKGIRRACPNIAAEFPQSSPGQQSWGQITNARQYSGFIGHYHTTTRKWDPGPFDFKSFVEKIRGTLSFPIIVRGDTPKVPRKTEDLRADVQELYKVNEEKGQGGFFPVGPFGESRLWHGGVHLHLKKDQPVYAPFAGRVVAVRMGPPSAIGSTNFVLLRHDITLGDASIRFFSLYFHVADETGREGSADAPGWLEGDSWQAHKKRGRVSLLDEPIQAGDIIARAGMAGPPDQRAFQVHFEIFASDDVMAEIGARNWTIIDGTAGGRFSDAKDVMDAIDRDPRDGTLSRRELVSFFAAGAERNLARFYGTLHVSEWVGNPDWVESLKLAPDFKDLDGKAIEELVNEQITPTLWWDDAVAKHAKLPKDGVVYHYHPVTFVKTVNEKLIEAAIEAESNPEAGRGEKVATRPIDDFDDVDGESFVDAAELEEEEDFGQDLTLEDLANGFPE